MKRLIPLLILMSFFPFLAKADPLLLGSPAPLITAKNQDGADLAFADVYAKGLTLVYFYPKAETPGCTAEACSLRDSYADLNGLGLRILGVSRDTPEAQKAFQKNRQLPFTLIADTDGKVAEAFHVPLYPVVGMTKRQSFLIRDGKIAWSSFNAQTSGAAAEIRSAVESLGKQ